jgi:hypothetical protein
MSNTESTAGLSAKEALAIWKAEFDPVFPTDLWTAIGAFGAAMHERGAREREARPAAEPNTDTVVWLHTYHRIGGGGHYEQADVSEIPLEPAEGYGWVKREPLVIARSAAPVPAESVGRIAFEGTPTGMGGLACAQNLSSGEGT